MTKQSNYSKYISIPMGVELLKKYSLQRDGLWEIYGEDPNCDIAGTHINPKLDVVRGRLQDVIEHAVNLSKFWAWGSGGEIRLIDETQIKTITPNTNSHVRKLIERKGELVAELDTIDKELKRFGY